MASLENLALIAALEEADALAASSTATLQNDLVGLLRRGSIASLLATGSYSWNDVDIVEDGSTFPRLTNDQCALIMATYTSAQLKTLLATEMSKTLVAPAAAIVFQSSNIECSPLFPFQTRGDQRASFKISLQITTFYGWFAKDASYVTFASPSSVNTADQLSEVLAALNVKNVRAALQQSFRRLFVDAELASVGMFVCLLSVRSHVLSR